MYSVYEQNNQVIEAKLQELTEVLGRICECTHISESHTYTYIHERVHTTLIVQLLSHAISASYAITCACCPFCLFINIYPSFGHSLR